MEVNVSHALLCSSGAVATPRPARVRVLGRTGRARLVLRSRHALQSTSLCLEGVGLVRGQTLAARATTVMHHTTNLSRRITNPAHALFPLGHRRCQSRIRTSTRAHGVQQSEPDEKHLQDAVMHVLSLRSELDTLKQKQLSPACIVAVKQMHALCQSGHREEVAAVLAQVQSCACALHR